MKTRLFFDKALKGDKETINDLKEFVEYMYLKHIIQKVEKSKELKRKRINEFSIYFNNCITHELDGNKQDYTIVAKMNKRTNFLSLQVLRAGEW